MARRLALSLKVYRSFLASLLGFSKAKTSIKPTPQSWVQGSFPFLQDDIFCFHCTVLKAVGLPAPLPKKKKKVLLILLFILFGELERIGNRAKRCFVLFFLFKSVAIYIDFPWLGCKTKHLSEVGCCRSEMKSVGFSKDN